MKIQPILLVGLLTAFTAVAQVELVDPTIGGVGYLLEPTRPTVHLPNSMVRIYPVRNDQIDDQIRSFPLTIISHRLGELFALMPGETDLPAAWDQEITTPYYYAVRFDDSLIRTEFTPTERCGYFRFTFPDGKATVHLANLYPGELAAIGNNTVTGEERFKEMKAFVYGEFSAPAKFTVTDGEKKKLVARTDAGTLEFRYGISFISVEQAKKNLQQEIPAWNFDKIKAAGKDRWNQLLGQIEVKGGTEQQRCVFYSSFYRAYERMVNITEDGRYYSPIDHKVHEDARPFYVDNWIWDMYRTVEPLQMLLNPKLEADKIQSYVRMYEQGGWMPSFAVLWGYYPCMNGNHAAAWMADAWFKGVRDFDIAKALEGLKKRSLEATLLPWRLGPKCALDDFYNQQGYFPALAPGEKETEPLVNTWEKRQPVAVTLENSFDDWGIAQLARANGQNQDYELFLKRAAFYRNVWNADKGFMWPKNAVGKWIEPFDPKFDGGPGGREAYDENNGYTYTWDVPQDYPGLFALMGGRQAAEAKLDQLFREPLGRSKFEFFAKFPDSSGLVGMFSMGNEPSFSLPYLYNYLGSPWKTQKRIRMLLETWFDDTIHGIPGDEDGGAMSAFAVFSMMGIYPVSAGVPIYSIGSPVFDRVKIKLSDGKVFTIEVKNNSRDNKYVQSVKLNGKPQTRLWLRHADIVNGGTLELEMGNAPNKNLGSQPVDLPPSGLTLNPASFE